MAIDREKYRKKCRYFNGVQNVRCQAGVKYDDFANRDLLIPCLNVVPLPTAKRPMGTCDKRECYTEADMDARDAKIEASHARHRKAAPVITQIRAANKGRSASGTIPCPACDGKGTLHWRISGYNGHMAGRCTTAGCLNWME